jgi:hypothetical protein
MQENNAERKEKREKAITRRTSDKKYAKTKGGKVIKR